MSIWATLLFRIRLDCEQFFFFLLKNLCERTWNKWAVMSVRVWLAKPQAASSAGIEDEWKETAMVLYSISESQYSADGVILLVGLWSYDEHLSVTFICNMRCTPNSVVKFVSYGW